MEVPEVVRTTMVAVRVKEVDDLSRERAMERVRAACPERGGGGRAPSLPGRPKFSRIDAWPRRRRGIIR